MMVYICTKFHENILNGIRVMKRTRKVNRWTDGWTDGRTDGRRAGNNTTRLRRTYKKLLALNNFRRGLFKNKIRIGLKRFFEHLTSV